MKHIPVGVTRLVSRQILLTQKHSPTLLFVGGVVGVGATVVAACKATLKLEDLLDEHQEMVNKVKNLEHVEYSEKDRKSDLAIVYMRSAGKFAKLYGPTFVLGVTSVVMLTGSHNILSKRNAGLTAAYAALEKGFKDYRGRVVAEYGEDKDRELRFGSHESVEVVEGKDGKPKEKKKKFPGDGGGSVYAKLFDEFNPNWSPQPELNVMFLRMVQSNLTQNLQAKGHLFLNDAYRALGLEDTKAGAVTGWVYDRDSAIGDNYVDFGIWDNEDMNRFHAFATGAEGAIWLDFNVVGPILDLI